MSEAKPHSLKVLQPAANPSVGEPAQSLDKKAAAPSAPNAPVDPKQLEQKIIDTIRTIYDPEIPVDIYELGLIYDIQIDADARVKVIMTLTAPGCPVAGSMPLEVEQKIEAIPEVRSAEVQLVWDPPWDKTRMSEAALLQLGMY